MQNSFLKGMRTRIAHIFSFVKYYLSKPIGKFVSRETRITRVVPLVPVVPYGLTYGTASTVPGDYQESRWSPPGFPIGSPGIPL